MIYSSNRSFKIWAYTISHCSLLLRSPMKYFDEEGYSSSTAYNIDIEFWAVEYINIPTFLEDILIKKMQKNKVPSFLSPFLADKKNNLFEIQTKKQKYYVVAGGMLIGKNQWGDKDRIFDFHQNLEHDEVLVHGIGRM